MSWPKQFRKSARYSSITGSTDRSNKVKFFRRRSRGAKVAFARRHRSRPLVAAALIAAMLMAVGASSTAGATGQDHARTSKKKALVPDFSYFRGKTITFIAPGTAGSSPAVIPYAVSSYMAKYLHATVNLEYQSNGGGVVGVNLAASSPANGLYLGEVGMASTFNEFFLGQNAYTFSVRTVEYFGGSYSAPDILVACPGSPYKSFSQMYNATSKVTFVNSIGAGGNLAAILLAKSYHIPYTFLNGYASNTLMADGCLRGDGDVAVSGLTTFANSTLTRLGTGYTPLLLMGPTVPGTPWVYLHGVPTLAEWAKSHPAKTAAGKIALSTMETIFNTTSPEYAMFVPKGTPKARVLALSDAYMYAVKQSKVKAAFVANGFDPGLFPAKDILPYIISNLNHETLLKKLVGGL